MQGVEGVQSERRSGEQELKGHWCVCTVGIALVCICEGEANNGLVSDVTGSEDAASASERVRGSATMVRRTGDRQGCAMVLVYAEGSRGEEKGGRSSCGVEVKERVAKDG